MVTATKTSIISRAFVLLGNQPFNTLDSGNPNVTAAVDLYDMLLPALLQRSWWQFARRTQSLSQATQSPPEVTGYNYAYQLPTDPKELLLFKLYPKQSDYRLYGNEVYSNEPTLTIDYIYEPPINEFPIHFTNSLIYKLAAALAPRVTQNFQIAQSMKLEADKVLLDALAIEGTSEPNETIQNDPIIEAHLNG